MNRIVLLGDSIFDNAAYVGAEGKSVADYLRGFLDGAAELTLAAVDGSKIEDVSKQAASIPQDTDRIFLSTGGNDITRHITYLQKPAETVTEVLFTFHGFVRDFKTAYSGLLKQLLSLNIPITVCTIYNCNFPSVTGQLCVETALSLFNDAIIQSAYELEIPYIDMRFVCTKPSDYVQEIEPSDSGGRKIAEALYEAVSGSE